MNGLITPRALRAIAILVLITGTPVAAQGLSWDLLGPPAGFRYETLGADSSGAIYASRYHRSGVFRSLDRGETWQFVAAHAMTSFAATRSSIAVVDAVGRVLRSVDRGQSWTRLTAVSAKGDTAMLAIAASPDGALYALTRVFFPNPAELLRSTDDGATWVTLAPPGERGVRIIGFARNGAVFIDADTLSYRSSDRGETWSALSTFTRSIGAVDIDGTGRLHALFARTLYSSTDEGATWTRGDSVPPGGYSHFTVADDGTIVIAGVGVLYSSTDGGASWQQPQMSASFVQPTALIAAGADFFASGTTGSGSGLTGGPGILRSTDHGASFTSVGRGLPGPEIASVVAVGDSVIVAATSEYLRFRMDRRTGAWQTLDNGSRVLEHGSDGALYAVTSGGYSRSTDGGLTWVSSDTTAKVYLTLASPGPAGEVVAATSSRSVVRTRDAGRTWQRLDSEFVEDVSAIAFDSSGAVLVGTLSAGIYRYDEPADRLRALDARVSSSPVSDIVVTPSGAIVVATSGTGVRRSIDGGATFDDAAAGLGSLNVNALAVTRGGYLLAGTDSSLFLSRTGGNSWRFVGDGLPSTITSIALDPSDLVVVGTATGVFISRESAASARPESVRTTHVELRCAPNPAASIVSVALTVPEIVDARVEVVDPTGAVVARLHDGVLQPGMTVLAWDPTSAAAGAYRIVVRGTGCRASLPIVVVR